MVRNVIASDITCNINCISTSYARKPAPAFAEAMHQIYITAMKNDGSLLIRFPSELKAAFGSACKDAGVIQSDVIRHLLDEAARYIRANNGKWDIPTLVSKEELVGERTKAKMFADLADPNSPASHAMQVLIGRVMDRRQQIAADSRPGYGEAGAETRTQVITPPPAHTAAYRRARSPAGSAEVKRP